MPKKQLLVALLGLGVALFLVTSPAMFGDWVYDDWNMVNSPLMDGWEDVPAILWTNANQYVNQSTEDTPSSIYRPTTMLTLVLTHILSPTPLAHHLVGLFLHLAAIAMLFRVLRAQDRVLGLVAVALALWFAVHPAQVESWVYINGRSDLVAGVILAALGCALVSKQRGLKMFLLCAAIGLLGMGAKLPFLFASAALWLGLWLRAGRPKTYFSGLLGLVVGIALVFIPRSFVLRAGANNGIAINLTDPELWAFLPQLEALGAERLLSMQPAAMQSLAYEAMMPMSVSEYLFLGVAVVGFVFVLVRRDWGGAVLTLGAAATLAPAVMVSTALWHGFDHYLYLPLILIVIAMGPHLSRLSEQLTKRSRRVPFLLATGVVLLCLVSTHLTSLAYGSDDARLAAVIAERPEDPTGYALAIVESLRTGDNDLARAILSEHPEPPWPGCVVAKYIELAEANNDRMLYDFALDTAVKHHVDDPILRAHVVRWHLGNGRWDEGLALVDGFQGLGQTCEQVKLELAQWADRREQVAGRLRSAADALVCD